MGEDEGLDAAGEDLDLLVRAQHEADVAAGAGRHRVEREGAGTGDAAGGLGYGAAVGRRRSVPCECLAQAPPPDVDEVGELALLIDEEEGPPAVAEPVQALEAGELDAEVEGLEGCATAVAGHFRAVVRSGTEDQGSRGDPAVLVGREGEGTQGEDDLGDPAGRGGGGRVGRGVDASGDVMVLGHAPAELEERDAGPAKQHLVVQFHDPADRADQVPVARAQAQAAGHGDAIPGAEEGDPHGVSRVVLVVEPEIEREGGGGPGSGGGHAGQVEDRLALDPRAGIKGLDIPAESPEEDLGEVIRILEGARAGDSWRSPDSAPARRGWSGAASLAPP